MKQNQRSILYHQKLIKQKKVLQFLKDNEGVTITEIEMFTGGTRAIVKTLEKNEYVEIVEKKIENTN